MTTATRPFRTRFAQYTLTFDIARPGAVRTAAFLILVSLLSTTFFSASSSGSFNALSSGSEAGSKLPDSSREDGPKKSVLPEQRVQPTTNFPALDPSFLLNAMPQAPLQETVTLYESTCQTPKTDFLLGEVVCGRVTGIPASAARRLTWLDPDGFIEKSTPISNNQTDNWTNPSTAQGLVAGFFVVRNRGTWRVNIITSRGSVRASAFYTVRDAAQPASDLTIFVSAAGDDTPTAGSQVSYAVKVANNGPSDAANVHFTDSVFTGITLNSVTQTSGLQNAFSCTDNGTVDCQIANLSRDAAAEFLVSFTAGAAGTIIENKVNVSSDTTELNASDNDSLAQPLKVVAGTPPAACVLNCPGNIVTTANTTQNGEPGAVLSFASPDASGECGTVSLSPQSATFFPVGSTVVLATSTENGGSCSFTVTVNTTAALSISCPATQTVTAAPGECEATVNPAAPTTNPDTGVTVNGARSDSQPLDAPYPAGPTTITWTATDSGGHTATCNQTIIVNANDTVPPTITAPADLDLFTGSTEESSCGTIVSENDLTPAASDSCSVNVSRAGVPAGNFFPVGTTTVTYTATDAAGNTATATQTISVVDNTPPLIKLNGDDPLTGVFDPPTEITVECGTGFTDPGATATDSCVGPVAVSATTVDTSAPGTYSITYTATDGTNVGTATRTVQVVDTTAPVITRVGPEVMTVECHQPFADPGATADDGCAGAFAATASTLDVNTPGTYTVTYTASDPAGNAATPVTRTVNVVDTTAPVITLNGANTLTVECHTTFTDPGATADDSCSGSIAVTASGIVNVDVPGSYTITYSATDGTNPATASRVVNVVDTTAPVITLIGANAVTVECHTAFTDAGATATDSCDSSVPVSVSGSVNVNVPGVYTLTYHASDDSTNAAIPVTRTVTVVDTTAPTISCPANFVVYLAPDSTATSVAVNYPAVTASESCSSATVTTSIASGSVFPVGTTAVTATATDAAGNSSTCSFTVTVLYNFTGFFSPIDNLPVLNIVNAGRAIPIKFSLSGNKGLNIFAPDSPFTVGINCNGTDPQNDVDETTTAGNSSLSYSGSQYIYTWKTENFWAGTCRQLVVRLNDGSEHRANFKFR